MARALAKSTLSKFKTQLESERQRLVELIAEHERDREEARLSETSADRSPDPGSAEAGSMKFEYEKELSIEKNLEDLLHKVEHALARVERGIYGICESCGESIPVARLEVLPYATFCVSCAKRS
jgi:RNA polymerase-binding protein DksA